MDSFPISVKNKKLWMDACNTKDTNVTSRAPQILREGEKEGRNRTFCFIIRGYAYGNA